MPHTPCMSLPVAFFSAPDDDAAAHAERRPGGPLGWPVETGTRRAGLFRREPVIEAAGPAFDGFAAFGYDGAVTLGTLEALLTGVPYSSLEENPRWGGTVSDEGPEDCGVLTVTDSLRDALAAADDETLKAVVGAWATTDELAPFDGDAPSREDLDGHLGFLRALRDLAARARNDGHRLYWYFGQKATAG